MVRSLFRKIILPILFRLGFFKFIKETQGTQTPITFSTWFVQKILGFNKSAYWPMHFSSTLVGGWRNVYSGIEVSPGLSPGCYIQAMGKIYIGDYTQVAANVGLISSNHELNDNRKHTIGYIRIGKYCWIGMGAIILPKVTLGDYTIVGAGAVVTKSFPEGYCVIAGNPARKIKDLDPGSCVLHKSDYEYNGYIKAKDFKAFSKNLYVHE